MVQQKINLFLPDSLATTQLGERLASVLMPGSVIFLRGNLGAGKTTLVQGLGSGLGINEPILSPTFTLICEYPEGRMPLYHLDLYRLDGAALTNLNLESYWQGTEIPLGITAIEWPERLVTKPPSYLDLELVYLPGQEGRQATLEPRGDFSLDLGAMVAKNS